MAIYSPIRACDFAWLQNKELILAISVADCVPVAIYDASQNLLGLCHAGWEGLRHDVILTMLQDLQPNPAQTQVYIGPHICSTCFDTDQASYHEFLDTHPNSDIFFKPDRRNSRVQHEKARYLVDLRSIVRAQFSKAGIEAITEYDACTCHGRDNLGWLFDSHRRNGSLGRITMALWHDG